MVIGYARTSTQDQNQDLQTDALKKAGCEKMYTDKVSGTVSHKRAREIHYTVEQVLYN